LTIDISRETEARLNDEARRRGISVDALLEWLLSERVAPDRAGDSGSLPELPVWHLGDRRCASAERLRRRGLRRESSTRRSML
jgi:hypothetical protein